MKSKEQYLECIEQIFYKYNLSGSLLESTYITGVKTGDLTPCYVDSRVKNGNMLRKELSEVVNQLLKDYPETTKPLYS